MKKPGIIGCLIPKMPGLGIRHSFSRSINHRIIGMATGLELNLRFAIFSEAR